MDPITRPPPLSDDERRARNRRIVERKRRLDALIERLAGRLPPGQVEEMTLLSRVGEWGIAMQILAALLVEDHIPISRDERDAFQALLIMFSPTPDSFPLRHVDDHEGTLAALNVQETDPPAD